jgi:hypothetical protein
MFRLGIGFNMRENRSQTIFAYGDNRQRDAESVDAIRRNESKTKPTPEMALPVAADFLNAREIRRCER